MGRELSTKPMHQGIRTPWLGGAVTTDGERHLRALHREHGHRMVNGSVAGGAGLGNGPGRSKVKTGR
jgi:hypothetical protein